MREKKDESEPGVLLFLLSQEERALSRSVGCSRDDDDDEVDFEALLFSSTKNKADWSFRRRGRSTSSVVVVVVDDDDDVFGTIVVCVVDDSKRRDRVRSRFLFFFVFFESVRRQSATLRAREPEREKIRE